MLVFVETIEQLHAVQAAFPQWRDFDLVAVLPAIDHLLSQQNIAHRTIEDFADEAALVAEGDGNTAVIEQLADCFDALLHQAASAVPRHEWVSLRAFFHPLKGLLDALTNRVTPLAAALDRLRPDRVVCFRRPEYRLFGLELLDKPAWSLTTHALPLVAETRGIAVTWVDDPTRDPFSHDYTPPAAGDGTAPAPSTYPHGRPTPDTPLMIHGLFADISNNLLDVWVREKGGAQCALDSVYALVEWKRYKPEIAAAMTWLRDRLYDDPVFSATFTKAGVDVRSFARLFFDLLFAQGLPTLLRVAPFLEAGLRRLGGRNVIVSGGLTGTNYVLAQAAAQVGVPFVSYHYGGFLGYSLLPMHERYDMAQADVFLVGGAGSVETFRQPSAQTQWNPRTKRAVPVATGMPWVDKARRDLRMPRPSRNAEPGAPRRFMYVMSALPGDNRYFGYVYPPDIRYWRFQRRLVEWLLARPDIRLVLKPALSYRYPQLDSPVFQWLEANVDPSRYEVVLDVRLEDCLDSGDMIFHDSPSTPVLYLAASDRPFALYVDKDVYRLRPRARELLARRAAFLAEDEEAVFAELERMLCLPDWAAAPVDDSFLREFATAGEDGRSAQRAASFIWDLACGRGAP